MKSAIAMLILLSFSVFSQVTPVEVEIKKFKVYVPAGFDSNDSSEITVSGVLPDHCHQAPKVDIISITDTEVKVVVKSLYAKGENCLQVQIPFSVTITLGVLDKGSYTISSNSDAQDIISIDQATSISMDESIYANVEYVEENEYDRTVKLVGVNPSDCFELDQIKYVHNSKDTYSILPILKVVSSPCNQNPTKFEYDFVVPKDLEAKLVLLHVRKMNGKSVNKLFRNKL